MDRQYYNEQHEIGLYLIQGNAPKTFCICLIFHDFSK